MKGYHEDTSSLQSSQTSNLPIHTGTVEPGKEAMKLDNTHLTPAKQCRWLSQWYVPSVLQAPWWTMLLAPILLFVLCSQMLLLLAPASLFQLPSMTLVSQQFLFQGDLPLPQAQEKAQQNLLSDPQCLESL